MTATGDEDPGSGTLIPTAMGTLEAGSTCSPVPWVRRATDMPGPAEDSRGHSISLVRGMDLKNYGPKTSAQTNAAHQSLHPGRGPHRPTVACRCNAAVVSDPG